jgi:hypothetical protein
VKNSPPHLAGLHTTYKGTLVYYSIEAGPGKASEVLAGGRSCSHDRFLCMCGPLEVFPGLLAIGGGQRKPQSTLQTPSIIHVESKKESQLCLLVQPLERSMSISPGSHDLSTVLYERPAGKTQQGFFTATHDSFT